MKTLLRFSLGVSIVFVLVTVGIRVVRTVDGPGPLQQVTFSPHPALAALGLGTSGQAAPSVADIAERVLPSVVNIASTRKTQTPDSPFFNHPFFHEFFGGPPPERLQRGLGSGVIVDASGVILTNNHVVAQADEIRVGLSGQRREFRAKVIGTDEKSDLAVLQLEDLGRLSLQPLPFGDSGALRLGDFVLAVGNPFGVGQTVTMGIVSAKGRANVGIVDYEDFIQTDAAINPGNSGGALVNMRGELVGINTAILSRSGGYQGIGFAIPSNMARPIMDSLRQHGKVIRGWLGVVIQDVDSALAKALKLPATEGVLISDIDPRGPAKKAGLKRGDFVISINGQAVETSGHLRNLIAGIGAGGTAYVEFYRGGRKQRLSITLDELPRRLGGTAGRAAPTAGPGEVGGMDIVPLTKALRKKYRIPGEVSYGLMLRGIKPGTPPAAAGLRRGDVILEANQVMLERVAQFQEVYDAAESQVLLLVYRQGSAFFLLLPK